MGLRRILVLSLALSLAFPGFEASAFTDIDSDHPLHDTAQRLERRGIINGFPDGSLRPDENLSRVAALKVALTAVRVAPLPGVDNSTEGIEFTDIEVDQWYLPYLRRGIILGITRGYKDNTFRPEQNISQAEYIALLLRSGRLLEGAYSREEVLQITDLPEDAWYSPLYAYLILTDRWPEELTIEPEAPISRGDTLILTESLLDYYWSSDANDPFPLPDQEQIDAYDLPYSSEDFLRAPEPENPVSSEPEQYIYGAASYYGPGFAGRTTANGEIFDPNEFTAAHKTLPFGTRLRVENVATGTSVIVRINDRGPYIQGRILDLSSRSFAAIAPLSQGVIQIRYTVLSSD